MARGRMISRSLSTSEKFASLNETAGKLAEFCQSLYPLLLAHADDWGCQQGDVFTVKHAVFPTSPRRLGEFESALRHLHNAGLITWYQADGKWVVYIRGFAAHQDLKGHNKGRPRKFAEPPENPEKYALGESGGEIPPKFPKRDASKENRTEPNRTYTVGATEPAPAEDSVELGDRRNTTSVGLFFRRFCELYSKHRHGAKYLIKSKIHAPLARSLLAVYGHDRLVKLSVVLLTTNDEWVSRTDRGIGILSTKAAWLDSLLAEYEAQHGEIRVA